MSLVLKLSPRAIREAREIQRYLERDKSDTGVRFRNDLMECLAHIVQFPRSCQIRHRTYRYAHLRVFRYSMVYSVGVKTIVVHCIRHMHRRTLKRFWGA